VVGPWDIKRERLEVKLISDITVLQVTCGTWENPALVDKDKQDIYW
jgi:hypothetical protein